VSKGEQDTDPDGTATVAVAFGPRYGPVTAKQVEDVIRASSRRGHDDVVVAAFSFDGPAQAIINEVNHPNLRIHIAHIRPDGLTLLVLDIDHLHCQDRSSAAFTTRCSTTTSGSFLGRS
jgi:hypothetical protein